MSTDDQVFSISVHSLCFFPRLTWGLQMKDSGLWAPLQHGTPHHLVCIAAPFVALRYSKVLMISGGARGRGFVEATAECRATT